MFFEQGKILKHERVWDPLVRLFHWSLVAAVVTAWWEPGEPVLHQSAGKFVLFLLIFRSVWGFIGPASARFGTFVRGPGATFRYVLSIFTGHPARHISHNPAGAVMVGLLLFTLSLTTGSGILMSTTALWGNAWVEWVHGISANIMVALVAAHVVGVLVASAQHKENLVWAMVTGWKIVPAGVEPYLGTLKLSWRALALSCVIVAVSTGLWSGSTTVFNASGWRLHKIILAELKNAGCTTAIVTGPRIEIYPHWQLVYDVATHEKNEPRKKAFPVSLALEKRPSVSLTEFLGDCGAIRPPPPVDRPDVEQKPETRGEIGGPRKGTRLNLDVVGFAEVMSVAQTTSWPIEHRNTQSTSSSTIPAPWIITAEAALPVVSIKALTDGPKRAMRRGEVLLPARSKAIRSATPVRSSRKQYIQNTKLRPVIKKTRTRKPKRHWQRPLTAAHARSITNKVRRSRLLAFHTGNKHHSQGGHERHGGRNRGSDNSGHGSGGRDGDDD